MVTKKTRTAQIGIFPIGSSELPTTPAINATTVLARNTASLASISAESLGRDRSSIYDNFYYGGVGTPTTLSLEMSIADLESGAFAISTPSGQSAIVAILSALFTRGDHILVVDTITFTTRWYIDQLTAKTGLDVTYYAPDAGGDIDRHFQPSTRGILMESPGSLTFEVQDVAAICALATKRGIVSILDNTWAASTFFAPFDHGVDISVLSLTKCHVGPTGISLGCVVTQNAALHQRIRNQAALLGLWVSPDACSRAMLALPTLDLRLDRQQATTLSVLAFLAQAEGVAAVFHPSLPDAVGHEIWKRDFSGAAPMVSIAFDGWTRADVDDFVDRFRIIKLGYGWGGALSLVTIFEANEWRSVSKSNASGACIRLYIGLEDAGDLVEDLRQAFERSVERRRRRF